MTWYSAKACWRYRNPSYSNGETQKETIFHQRELVAGKLFISIGAKKGGGCLLEVYDYSGHSIGYELDILLYTLTWMKQTGLLIVAQWSQTFEDGFWCIIIRDIHYWFFFRFITVPAKWMIKSGRQWVLNIYSDKPLTSTLEFIK